MILGIILNRKLLMFGASRRFLRPGPAVPRPPPNFRCATRLKESQGETLKRQLGATKSTKIWGCDDVITKNGDVVIPLFLFRDWCETFWIWSGASLSRRGSSFKVLASQNTLRTFANQNTYVLNNPWCLFCWVSLVTSRTLFPPDIKPAKHTAASTQWSFPAEKHRNLPGILENWLIISSPKSNWSSSDLVPESQGGATFPSWCCHKQCWDLRVRGAESQMMVTFTISNGSYRLGNTGFVIWVVQRWGILGRPRKSKG